MDYRKVEMDGEHLAREDKPLFSTNLIHRSRVLSITWLVSHYILSLTGSLTFHRLSDDILISHSGPILLRGRSVDEMYEMPGEGELLLHRFVFIEMRTFTTVTMWRWLAFDRFLKNGQVSPIMRGTIWVCTTFLAKS